MTLSLPARVGAWFALTLLLSWGVLATAKLAGLTLEGPTLLAVEVPYLLAPWVASALWRRLVVREPGPISDGAGLRFTGALWIGWIGPLIFLWTAAGVAHLCGWATLDLSGQHITDQVIAAGRPEDVDAARSTLAASPVPFAVDVSFQGLIAGLLFSPIWYPEEVAWRGVLHGELRRLGFWNAAWMGGLLWGIWRAPLLIAGGFLPGDVTTSTLLLIAGSIPVGALLAWLRETGGSVWPSTLAVSVLAMVGAFDQVVLAGGTPETTSPLGAAGALTALALVGVLFGLAPRGPRVPVDEPVLA